MTTTKNITLKTEYFIRSSNQTDLSKLKWAFPDWNSYYQDKWQQKLDGKLDMYVAVINDFPIAYYWLDWTKLAAQKIGDISSFAVISPFQGLGIGTFMMQLAEDIFLEKGLETSQTGTYKTNERARKLYERIGYKITGNRLGTAQYITESGETKTYSEDCWILQKLLNLK